MSSSRRAFLTRPTSQLLLARARLPSAPSIARSARGGVGRGPSVAPLRTRALLRHPWRTSLPRRSRAG
eukprot:2716803-Alexandrium_andersonii.AAC.1